MKLELKHLKTNSFGALKHLRFNSTIIGVVVIVGFIVGWFVLTNARRASEENIRLSSALTEREATIASMSGEIETLKNEDLRKTNDDLKQKIAEVEKTYSQAEDTIETLADARSQGVGVTDLEKDMAAALNLLGSLNYENYLH